MKISKKIINSRHLDYIAGVSFVLTKKSQKRAQDSNNSFQVNQLIKGLKNKSNSYFLKNSLTALALFYMWCPSALMAMNDEKEEEKQSISLFFKGSDAPKEGNNDDIFSYFWEDNYNSTFYLPSLFSSGETFLLDDEGQQDPTRASGPSVNTDQNNRFESPELWEMSEEPLPYSSQHAIERSSCQNLDNRPAAKVENPPQDSDNDEIISIPHLNVAIIQDINGEYDLANHNLALGGQQANKDCRSRSNNLLGVVPGHLHYAETYNNIKDREEKSHNAKKRTRSLSLERKPKPQKTLEGYTPKDAIASLNPMPRSEPLLLMPIASHPSVYMVMTPLVPIPHSISGRGNILTAPSRPVAHTNFAALNTPRVQMDSCCTNREKRRQRLQNIHNAYPQKIKNMTPHAVAKMLSCNHKTARRDLKALKIPFKDLSRKSIFPANLKNPLLYSNEDKITSLEHFNLGLQFEEERKHNLAIHHYGLSFLDTIE